MLEQIVESLAFASVTTPARLVDVYVPSDQLSGLTGAARPEAQLMRALTSDQPQRVQVIGAAGAGKTGMILRVLAHLAIRETRHEVLLINVGDDHEQLYSSAAFMRTVLQLVQVQGHRFGSVDQDLLRAAAADEHIQTGPQVEHRATVGAPLLSYSVGLKEAYDMEKFGENPSRVRQDFEDVVRHVAEEVRPVVLIDDTERFVAPRSGEVDEDSISNLFHHAIRTIAEVQQLDLVVAVHPRYKDVEAVVEVTERYGFAEVHVPELPAASDEPALARILQRRLDRYGIDGSVEVVVEPEALAQITGVYFMNGHDLREVLDLAQRAARAAYEDGSDKISPRHVQPLLDAR